ncbi:MAG: hypothetical protein ACRD00_00320 [Thermoanaerobaculia bacterium]
MKKFHSIEEMEGEVWRAPGDPALWKAIAAVWDFASKTVGYRVPPGVYKHRSIEEALRLRAEWEQANVRVLRTRRSETES